MDERLITGVISTGQKPIIFSSKEKSFEFSFMTDSVYSFSERNNNISLPVTNGFILGNTHNNRSIAIYAGDTSINMHNIKIINTPAYVESRQHGFDLCDMEFEAIQFYGGTLNNVFNIDRMQVEFEDSKTIISYKDDGSTYYVTTSEYCFEIRINSSIHEEFGSNGNSISNTDAILTLKFDKPQPMIKVFEHYNRMKDLLSFMTYRNNVGFERVLLMKTHPVILQLVDYAEVFIKNDETLTNKQHDRNISFDDLGNALPGLISLLYDSEDKKTTISLGFIPADDKEATMISETRVRQICSALECEINYITDIKIEENNELGELISVVKKAVKDFRKTHSSLTNDTYNLIFSSIGLWSLSLTEKLCALCHKYTNEMILLNHSSTYISDSLIKEFVQYRNDITHGRHRILENNTAITSHILCGIVYCCILERVGVSREKIDNLCIQKIAT